MSGRSSEAIGTLEALLLFALATGLSVAASHVLFRLIEVPTHHLSRRIRWSRNADQALEELQDGGSEPIVAGPQAATE